MKLLKAILFFILFCYASYAQTVPDNPGQIKVYDSYQPSKGTQSLNRNKISINPLGVLIGDYPLYYERMFGNTFSLEVAAGLTYQNYIGNVLDFSNNNSSVNDNSKSYKIGTTYSISPKVYLDDDGFEGSYLALCYRHRYYANDISNYQGATLPSVMHENKKINSFTFNYGYLFNIGKGFILDYYVGIGISTVTSSTVVAEYNQNYSYTNPNSTFLYQNKIQNKTLPTGMMGLKVSYEF
jgi:hypothetical protein